MASMYDKIGLKDKDIANDVLKNICPDCFNNQFCKSLEKGVVTGCPKFFKYRLKLYKDAVKDLKNDE